MDDSSAKSVPIPCTMLVLVGEQRIPNAIPIRQHPGAIKRVKMVYSGRTSAAARDLMRWLLTQDVEVRDPEDLILTEKVNDFAQQCSVVKSILGSYRPAEIFVNLTGGTKIMSLAAAELARSGGYKTIYVDTESESFWQVHPIPRRDPLNVVFDVADYWELHGQSFSSPDAPSMLEQGAANFLARNFPQLEPLLHRLQALDRRRALSLPTLTRCESEFLSLCEKAGPVSKSSSSRAWHLCRPGFFKQNDWLECVVYSACLRAGFDDVRWKVKVSGTPTDIDVAATRGPLLLVCSCKSGDFKNSHLDELNAQARLLGGPFCKKAIVLTEGVPFNRRRKLGLSRVSAVNRRCEKRFGKPGSGSSGRTVLLAGFPRSERETQVSVK